MFAPALAFLAAVVVLLLAARALAERRARERVAAARAQAAAVVQSARLEAAAARRARETEVRKELLALRSQAEEELAAAAEAAERREEQIASRESKAEEAWELIEQRRDGLEQRQRDVQSLRDRAAGLRHDATQRGEQARGELERIVGENAEAVAEALVQGWVEDARSEAAQRIRKIDTLGGQGGGEGGFEREGKRIMDIAISRYQNHFLTERNLSNIRVGGELCSLFQNDGADLYQVLQEVANVQLHINEDIEAVRLEGLDGVGREVARRALNRLSKRGSEVSRALEDPRTWSTKIRDNLEREIQTLGKKAFSVLEIPRAHPDIVMLVGALNYRTSYTQNQWLHAVEASFLAGMMASEMGLDIKLARRATLMHDIGKALTHKIDGSHAVIGADIARSLGEAEIVANAIGAHHADEPPGSVYAFLVAAADAMSGARPGARREATEGFTHRVEDLERIGVSYPGVDRAHAVHGGRELRVYVDEARVDDRGVIELSAAISGQIAEEMTFPGQIKVTVIRSYEAVSQAS